MQKSEFTIAKGSDHRGRQLGTLTRYASKLVLEREASRCVMVSTRMDAKFEQLDKDVKNRVDDLECSFIARRPYKCQGFVDYNLSK